MIISQVLLASLMAPGTLGTLAVQSPVLVLFNVGILEHDVADAEVGADPGPGEGSVRAQESKSPVVGELRGHAYGCECVVAVHCGVSDTVLDGGGLGEKDGGVGVVELGGSPHQAAGDEGVVAREGVIDVRTGTGLGNDVPLTARCGVLAPGWISGAGTENDRVSRQMDVGVEVGVDGAPLRRRYRAERR